MATVATEVVFEDESVRELLEGLIMRTKEFKERDRKIIGILSSVVYRDIIQHFDRQESSEGPWPKWSASYTKFMSSIGKGGNKLLQDSGRLRQAFQPVSVRKTNEGLLWFNNAKTASGFPYANAHNEGGKRLPKREFMWISDSALSEMEEQLLNFIAS